MTTSLCVALRGWTMRASAWRMGCAAERLGRGDQPHALGVQLRRVRWLCRNGVVERPVEKDRPDDADLVALFTIGAVLAAVPTRPPPMPVSDYPPVALMKLRCIRCWCCWWARDGRWSIEPVLALTVMEADRSGSCPARQPTCRCWRPAAGRFSTGASAPFEFESGVHGGILPQHFFFLVLG